MLWKLQVLIINIHVLSVLHTKKTVTSMRLCIFRCCISLRCVQLRCTGIGRGRPFCIWVHTIKLFTSQFTDLNKTLLWNFNPLFSCTLMDRARVAYVLLNLQLAANSHSIHYSYFILCKRRVHVVILTYSSMLTNSQVFDEAGTSCTRECILS